MEGERASSILNTTSGACLYSGHHRKVCPLRGGGLISGVEQYLLKECTCKVAFISPAC